MRCPKKLEPAQGFKQREGSSRDAALPMQRIDEDTGLALRQRRVVLDPQIDGKANSQTKPRMTVGLTWPSPNVGDGIIAIACDLKPLILR
jgi:hypothetical protein